MISKSHEHNIYRHDTANPFPIWVAIPFNCVGICDANQVILHLEVYNGFISETERQPFSADVPLIMEFYLNPTVPPRQKAQSEYSIIPTLSQGHLGCAQDPHLRVGGGHIPPRPSNGFFWFLLVDFFPRALPPVCYRPRTSLSRHWLGWMGAPSFPTSWIRHWSWSVSIRLGCVCIAYRSTTDSTGAGRRVAPPAEPPGRHHLPALSP